MIEAALREKGFLLEQEEWEKSSITYNERKRGQTSEPVSDLLTSSGIFCKIRIDKVKEKRFSVVSYDRMELYIWKK